MNVGAAVIVIAEWSWFRGRTGVVVARSPLVMVRLDGESIDMRFGETALVPTSTPQHMVAGE